jgi:hypothetical protein
MDDRKYYVEEDRGVELNVTLDLRCTPRDLSATGKVQRNPPGHQMSGIDEQGS